MTNEKIAERIQTIIDIYDSPNSDLIDELCDLRDELDPPKPKPGTVVWWRMSGGEWQIGIVSAHMQIIDSELDAYEFEEIEWKPARIFGPNEVAIRYEELIDAAKDLDDSRLDAVHKWLQYYIAREKPERMEAEYGE